MKKKMQEKKNRLSVLSSLCFVVCSFFFILFIDISVKFCFHGVFMEGSFFLWT